MGERPRLSTSKGGEQQLVGGDDTDDLSTLIGEIYDTTLDAALREQALKNAAGFIGGSNTGLCSIDARNASGRASYAWSFDPSYVRAYFEKYSRVDPGDDLLGHWRR
jgi:hypothetical protein